MASPTSVQQKTVWQLDPAHSSVEFSVKHMMMTTVRGRFKEMHGTLEADEEHPEGCCVDVEIVAASIDTGVAERDAHLRSADFLDVERYPTIAFHSTKAEGDFSREGDRFRVIGDLTIRDTTMPVTLDCVYQGRGQDPWGKERAGFSGSTEIDRREWGLKWNQAIETGGVLVANRVRVEVEAQFVRQEAAGA
ncbi:MAG TPA: YceI family protein [Gemmatimonadaceae bacterium]|nr:YceI family protein [Gemmatimonadaceae bacterium]